MESRDKPTKEQKETWHSDPKNWKLFFFYYNPEDKRLFPPKRIGWTGWTINFANPLILALIGMLILFLLISNLIKKN